MHDNEVWDLVELPNNSKLVGYKLVEAKGILEVSSSGLKPDLLPWGYSMSKS